MSLTTYVYFVKCLNHGQKMIKIGVSKSPEDRIKNLSTGTAGDLVLLAKLECPSPKSAFHIEAGLHQLFDFCKRKGEWFAQASSLNKFIWEIKRGLFHEEALRVAEELAAKHMAKWERKKAFKDYWANEKPWIEKRRREKRLA